MTALVITKLDVLTGIDPLNVGVRYLGPEGASFDEFPYHQSIVHKVRGDYAELPGWQEDIRGVRAMEDLPQAARDYLDYVSEFVGVPIAAVGVGPGRDQVIWTDYGRTVVEGAGGAPAGTAGAAA
jgi:adenylosuccinate synthase